MRSSEDMHGYLYSAMSKLGSDKDEDSLSEPGSLSSGSPAAKQKSASRSQQEITQERSQGWSFDSSCPGQVTPRKRRACGSSTHPSNVSSVKQAKPGRQCAMRAKAESNQKESRGGRAASKETGDCDCSTSGCSSNSESQEDSGDDYTLSSQRKLSSKAKAVVSSSDARARRALAVARKEKGIYREDEDMIRQSQEESRARLEDIDRLLAMGSGSQASSSSSVSVPREAGKLRVCPFCHEEMPKIKSKKLIAVMQHWLDHYHQKRRIGSTATLEACQQHRNEKSIIPEGNKKWRKRLSKDKLKRQIENESNGFLSVMRERIVNPMSSEWFKREVEIRKAIGRQADTASAQMQRLDEEQAGYFGELGWEAMRSSLIGIFVTRADDKRYDLKTLCSISAVKMANLTPEKFIERVLIPELVLLLIIKDAEGKRRSITMEEARQIRNESTLYGIAMFPSTAMGNVAHGRNAFGDKISPSQTPKKEKRETVERRGSNAYGRVSENSTNDLENGNAHSQKSKKTIRGDGSRMASASTKGASSSWPGSSARPRPRPVAKSIVTTSVIDLISPDGRETETISSPLFHKDHKDDLREGSGDGDLTITISSSLSAATNDGGMSSSSQSAPSSSTNRMCERGSSSISAESPPRKPTPRPAYRNALGRPSGRIEGY